jgi:general secretion pathway protein M
MSETPNGANRRSALDAWWRGLATRERVAVGVAAAVLLLYGAWALAVQPAWKTLSTAPARLDRLDAELQAMQGLASDAQQARAQPALSAAQSAAALQIAAERLRDQATLSVQGDRAVLTLAGTDRQALREFLAEARGSARARTIEARVTIAPDGLTGTIVLALGVAS